MRHIVETLVDVSHGDTINYYLERVSIEELSSRYDVDLFMDL